MPTLPTCRPPSSRLPNRSALSPSTADDSTPPTRSTPLPPLNYISQSAPGSPLQRTWRPPSSRLPNRSAIMPRTADDSRPPRYSQERRAESSAANVKDTNTAHVPRAAVRTMLYGKGYEVQGEGGGGVRRQGDAPHANRCAQHDAVGKGRAIQEQRGWLMGLAGQCEGRKHAARAQGRRMHDAVLQGGSWWWKRSLSGHKEGWEGWIVAWQEGRRGSTATARPPAPIQVIPGTATPTATPRPSTHLGSTPKPTPSPLPAPPGVHRHHQPHPLPTADTTCFQPVAVPLCSYSTATMCTNLGSTATPSTHLGPNTTASPHRHHQYPPWENSPQCPPNLHPPFSTHLGSTATASPTSRPRAAPWQKLHPASRP